MPRRDGTGPMGFGEKTGNGLGPCIGVNAVKGATFIAGLGLGCRRGFGRRLGRNIQVNRFSKTAQKAFLQEQKHQLQNRMRILNNQLEGL